MFNYSPLNSTFLQSTTFEIANTAYCDHPADTAQLFTYPHNTPNCTFIYVFSVLRFHASMTVFERQYFEVHNFPLTVVGIE